MSNVKRIWRTRGQLHQQPTPEQQMSGLDNVHQAVRDVWLSWTLLHLADIAIPELRILCRQLSRRQIWDRIHRIQRLSPGLWLPMNWCWAAKWILEDYNGESQGWPPKVPLNYLLLQPHFEPPTQCRHLKGMLTGLNDWGLCGQSSYENIQKPELWDQKTFLTKLLHAS